jgi:hypothetical protein
MNETKTCNKCYKSKAFHLFYQKKCGKYGLTAICRECLADQKRGRNEKLGKRTDGEIEYPKTKRCFECKLTKLAECFNKRRTNVSGLDDRCRECDLQRVGKRFRIQDKAKKAESDKRYYEKNKVKIKKNTYHYRIERMKHDVCFRIVCRVRNRISSILRGKTKELSTSDAMGCSIDELRIHLAALFYPNKETGEQMSWNNYGQYGWHVDHIIPLSSFDLTDPEQFKKACHYSNLQPLWAKENLSKGSRYEYI